MMTYPHRKNWASLLGFVIAIVVITAVSQSVYAAEKLAIWSIDRYANIVREQKPDRSARSVNQLKIVLAKGESRDAVFMIGPVNAAQSLEIALEGTAGQGDGFLKLLETTYLRNRLGHETGDIVRPFSGTLEIPAGESRQIYVRADTHDVEVEAGTHEFVVTIRDAKGKKLESLPGEATVWDFTLPSSDVLPNNTWAQFEDSSFGNGEMAAAAMRDMKRSGLNAIFIHGRETPRPVSVDDKGNVSEFDDTLFRARLEPVLQAWREAPGNDRLLVCITLAGMYEFGRPDSGVGVLTDPWKTTCAQWLAHMKKTLTEMGIADTDWLLTVSDETTYPELFKSEVPVAEYIRSVEPGIRLMCNSSLSNEPISYSTIMTAEETERFFSLFDVFQPNLYYVFGSDPSIGKWFVEQAHLRNKQVWAYQCKVDLGAILSKTEGNAYFVENNLYQYYRVFAWELPRYGITGIGMWTYCAQVTGQADWTCHLAYGIDGELLHSRRYDMYREGTDDYRYIVLLRELAARQGKVDQQNAERLIQHAAEDVTTKPNDTSRCDYWRQRIADEILRLEKNQARTDTSPVTNP